jgi:polyhydroxyalkanoate synthesis regulator phasin
MAESGKTDGPEEGDAQSRVAESLRTAVERTFAATADSAAETRGRAQELLDEVAKRGQGAREASAEAASKVVGAAERIRGAGREDVRDLESRLEGIEEQLKSLTQRVATLDSLSKRVSELEALAPRVESEPQVEG